MFFSSYFVVKRGRMMRYKLFLLVLLIVLSSYSKTYYVSKSGNDNSAGTEADAWLTLKKAASTMVAGDTLLVKTGNYQETVTVKKNGESGKYITFKVAPAAVCTVKNFIISGSYIRVEGFHFFGQKNAYQAMINLSGDSCIIENNFFEHDTTSRSVFGIRFDQFDPPDSKGSSEYCIIRGNTFKHFMYLPLNIFGVGHLIEENKLITIWHDCIRVWGHDHVIRKNLFEDIGDKSKYDIEHEDIIQVFGRHGFNSYNIVFEQNVIRDCKDAQIGILASEGAPKIEGWTFRNNIFSNIGKMMSICMEKVRFYNNVFYKCTQNTGHTLNFANAMDGAHGAANYCEVKNNIFYLCGKDPASSQQGWYAFDTGLVGNESDHNFIAGKMPETEKTLVNLKGTDPNGNPRFNFLEANGINNGRDPRFIDPEKNDFRLQEDSPARGKGLNLSASGFITNDFNGNLRQVNQNWDIGAFLYQDVGVYMPQKKLNNNHFNRLKTNTKEAVYSLSGRKILSVGRLATSGVVKCGIKKSVIISIKK